MERGEPIMKYGADTPAAMSDRHRQATADRRAISLMALFLLPILVLLAGSPRAQEATVSDKSVVHALLFFSPTCPHCHKVMTQDIPPLLVRYGNRLQIATVSIVDAGGRDLYMAAIDTFKIPEEDRGVPMLVVGNTVLTGSRDIPERLPDIIEQGLAGQGISWPSIPGLAAALAQQGEAETGQEPPAAGGGEPSTASQGKEVPRLSGAAQFQRPGVVEMFNRDPAGNSLAVVVLLGMVASVLYLGYGFFRRRLPSRRWPSGSVPVLAALGLGVASYLSWVALSQNAAVCGPVGDCNAVQQSPYAHLFGVIPVAWLGLAAYLALAVLWLLQRFGPAGTRGPATLGIWGLAGLGTLFSIYLTFLEPFVIGATCVWCVTSAIVITLTLWAASAPVQELWAGRT